MAPKITKGGTKDPQAARPGPARNAEPVKKAGNAPLGQVAVPNPSAAVVAQPRREPCNHEKYGVKGDLWEWVIHFTPEGEVKVVGQDQRGGPGLVVKKITTTTIKARIQKDFVCTQSASIYRLIGKLWLPEMKENRFSEKIMEAFRDGFPENWAALLQEEWPEWKLRQESSQLNPPRPFIRGIPVPLPAHKPVARIVEAPPVEIPSPAWETWEEEDDENRREKDFPRYSYQVGALARLPAVPVQLPAILVESPTDEPEEPVASTTKPTGAHEGTQPDTADNIELTDASTEKDIGTVATSLATVAQGDEVEGETGKETSKEKTRTETGDVVPSELLTEDEADVSVAPAEKTVDVNDLEAMLALQSSAIRAAVGAANRAEEVALAHLDQSGAPSTSFSSNQVPSTSQSNYELRELRRRNDVCYNYELNQSAAKEKRKNDKGFKSQEKNKKATSEEVESDKKLAGPRAVQKRKSDTETVEGKKAEPEVGPEVKVVSTLPAKKRKSDTVFDGTEESGPEDEPEVTVATPTKRQRRRSSQASPAKATPSSSSHTKPRHSDQYEEKNRVEMEDDTWERMTRNQHREVFSVARKEGSGRKGVPTKVTMSGSKRIPLSPPARISMSAPVIGKKKVSLQKDKKLRGLLLTVLAPCVKSPERGQVALAKKPRRGTPLFKSVETMPALAVASPHVHFQVDSPMSDDFEDDEEEIAVEVKKPAPRKKVAKETKEGKIPKNKKTKAAAQERQVEDEEEEEKGDSPSIYKLVKNARQVAGAKKTKKTSGGEVCSPEIFAQKPRVTRAHPTKAPLVAPKPYKIPAVEHSVKKTKKGKRLSIVPVRPGRRNANWFGQTVEALSTVASISSPEKKKAAADLLFKNRASTSRTSTKLSLGTVDWDDEDEIDFQPQQAAQSNKVFRMSMGKATRRPQPRRDTCYDPSNNNDAILRQNFQGFMEKEKTNKEGRGLKRHGNMSDLRQVSPKKRFGMPSKLPESRDEDFTEEEESQGDEE